MTPLTKLEFIDQLSSKLEVIPINERENILAYYSNHIQNSEDEITAINSLGTPSEVAAEILASYVKKVSHAPHGVPAPNSSSYQEGHKVPRDKRRLGWPIIILLIVASPAIIGLVFGLGGGLIGLFAGLWAIIFSIAVSGFAFVATGLAGAVLSVPILFQDAGFGLLSAGMGLVLIGIGIYLIILTISIGKWLISLAQTLIGKFTRGPGRHERTV